MFMYEWLANLNTIAITTTFIIVIISKNFLELRAL